MRDLRAPMRLCLGRAWRRSTRLGSGSEASASIAGIHGDRRVPSARQGISRAQQNLRRSVLCCWRGDFAVRLRWIRLYPVPFRALEDEQQFKKYQRVQLRLESHSGDRRPETRRPDRDSIQLLGSPIPTTDSWARRRRFVEPLMAPSMCDLIRQQRRDGASLGVFRPKRVIDLVIEERNVTVEKREIARAWAAQPSLLGDIGSEERRHQLRELELIPWSFKYRYECQDRSCKTHTQSIIDWEIATFYRRVRGRPDWRDRMKQRWISEVCGNDRDTALFVGNQHQHPASFLVLGVWWPPRRPEQLALGDL